MRLLDALFSINAVRKALWQAWYPYLTKKLQNEDVVFLNYAYEESPALGIPLDPADEPNRACAQLYHRTASQVDLAGKNVLEVSCGHGGGASYITRTFKPQSYTGLDLNPKGIAFCSQRHPIEGLSLIQGDAQSLPFPDNHFDALVNVEASHCYPEFPKFLEEVQRVLKPRGHFLYADFRFEERYAEWDTALEASPLKQIAYTNISPDVVRGMDINSARSVALVEKLLPSFLHQIGKDFAGVQGSRIYEGLKNGGLEYRCYCFEK